MHGSKIVLIWSDEQDSFSVSIFFEIKWILKFSFNYTRTSFVQRSEAQGEREREGDFSEEREQKSVWSNQ